MNVPIVKDDEQRDESVQVSSDDGMPEYNTMNAGHTPPPNPDYRDTQTASPRPITPVPIVMPTASTNNDMMNVSRDPINSNATSLQIADAYDRCAH